MFFPYTCLSVAYLALVVTRLHEPMQESWVDQQVSLKMLILAVAIFLPNGCLCSSRHIGWTRHFPRDRSLACKATKVPKAQMCFVGTLTWSWYPWSCWLLSKTPLDLKCIQFCRICFLPRKAGRPYFSLSKSSRHATRKGLTPPKNSFSELYFFEWSLWTKKGQCNDKNQEALGGKKLPQKPLCI